MLDAARQAIRWSIPGWLLYLFLVLFLWIDLVIAGRICPPPGTDPSNSLPLVCRLTEPHVLIGAGVAGIPIGFTLYQIYYVMYWRGPFFFRLGPRDKGAWVLRGMNVATLRRLFDDEPIRTEWYTDTDRPFYDDWEPFNLLERIRRLLQRPFDRNNWLELLFVTREAALRYRTNWWMEESL